MARIRDENAVLCAYLRLARERRGVLLAHTAMLEEAIAEGRAPADAAVQLDLLTSEMSAIAGMHRELVGVVRVGEIFDRQFGSVVPAC